MTKIGVDETAKVDPDSQPPPQYVVNIPAGANAQTQQMLLSARRWYVTSILSAIFCCPLFGIFGLIHSLFADHEASQGNVMKHRRRLRQARGWTIASIVLGVIFIALLAAGLFIQIHRHHKAMRKGGEDKMGEWSKSEMDKDNMDDADYNPPQPEMPDFDMDDMMRGGRDSDEFGRHHGGRPRWRP